MIYEIRKSTTKVPVEFLCKYFGVSSSGYYFWKKRSENIHSNKRATVCDAIKKYFKISKSTYGSPRIYDDLKEAGILVSENTVAKYMKEMGLDARLKKKYRVQTTDSNHNHPIAPRLFKVEDAHPLPSKAGKLLAGDITYLRVGYRFIYLAVVIDLYNREVIGWSMGNSLETSLVLRALDSAMKKVGPDAEIIFHSDRGSQYASKAYRNFLKNKNIKPSMSRRGNCYDNAYVESWFSSLKKEWIYRNCYSTEAELKALVFEYIEVWYNKKRKHSSLGNQSPEKYKLTNLSH
ncbi:MAG: IS3 family transposase [Bdellovibrionaceae bacterium]|nr:IS3 family transposase [Pseudobdellovibrionaceae bacterium]MCB9027111.1 IS3 family transposase [Pseudobdellovibrionaceae bacterium]